MDNNITLDYIVDNEIGKRIKTRRKFLGVTQEELAEKVGFSNKGTICNIESGKYACSVKKLREIANALDVTFEWLCYGNNPEGKSIPTVNKTDIQSPTGELTELEQELLSEFRKLNTKEKISIINTITEILEKENK